MKLQSLLITMTVALASSAGMALPADAASAQVSSFHIVSSGSAANGGWIAYTPTKSPGVRAQAAVAVGGGIWTFGSYINQIGQKVCYSQYWHPAQLHSASARLDSSFVRQYAGPGAAANASVARWTLGTCYAYWNV